MAEVLSPAAGKIIEVNITVGQKVTEDDEIFILEAMKMENPIIGESGTVKEIRVNAGERVEEGDVLAVLV